MPRRWIEKIELPKEEKIEPGAMGVKIPLLDEVVRRVNELIDVVNRMEI